MDEISILFSHGEESKKANITVASALIVGTLVLIKLILLVICIVNKNAQSKALKKDHQVVILMNLGALGLGFLESLQNSIKKNIVADSLGTHGKWTEELIIFDDIGAICLALYGIYIWIPQIQENVRRACYRVVEDDSATKEIRKIAEEVLNKIEDEGVRLANTIVCHGGDGDKTIIMQMIVSPDSINHHRVKSMFSELKSALVKNENTGPVLIH